MTAPALILYIMQLVSAGPGGNPYFETVFDPTDITAATGNGALTICTNAFGRVALCKWPSPGYYDQVSYRVRSSTLPDMGVEPWHGAMWGLRMAERTYWITGSPWHADQRYLDTDSMIIHTKATLPGTSINTTQKLFVYPHRDLLVAQLKVSGAPAVPQIYWYADFTPRTRLVPELPIAGWFPDESGDFAAVAANDGQTLYHFSPNQPGPTDWDRARHLLAEKTPSSGWKTFDDGIWIAYTSPERIQSFQCGNTTDSTSAFGEASTGHLSGTPAAVGPCNSAVQLIPSEIERSYTATVFVAFGNDSRHAEDTLAFARERGYDHLLLDTWVYWQDWLGKATLPATDDPELEALCKRALLIIATAMDCRTGGVVRALTTQPLLGLDRPREGIWATRALDTAGRVDLAEKHCRFYLETVRTTSEKARPVGSLPAALYTNGVEAVPSVILDLEAPAWLLWSISQHTLLLTLDEKARFLKENWQTIQEVADFLTYWADGRTGFPLHSFDKRVWRDTRRPELLLSVHLGIRSGLDMANILVMSQNSWQQRLHDLRALILHHCTEHGAWTIEDPLSFWPVQLTGPDIPAWDSAGPPELDSLGRRDAGEAIRRLHDIAQVSKGNPILLDQVKKHLKPTMVRALSGPHDGTAQMSNTSGFPDTFNASLCYLTAAAIYEDGPG